MIRPYPTVMSHITPAAYSSTRAIPIDISIEDSSVIVHAELPGMLPDDLSIELDKNILRIEKTAPDNENKEHSNDNVVRERTIKSAKRAIELPHNVAPGSATSPYKNGILEITLPIVDKVQSTRIPIGP